MAEKRQAITPAMKINCVLWLAGIACPECHEPVLPGQRIEWDHRHCVALDGPHEYQNLRPVHYDPCHKKKTARDIKALAKTKRLRGETKTGPKAKIANRGFDKTRTRKFSGQVIPRTT